MSYPANAIANYFLDLAAAEGKSLTPMQVQKLVFYAHGWNLAIHDAPLIDEQVEAWKFGPVIRSLYIQLRDFGNRPVTRRIHSYRMATENGKKSYRLEEAAVDSRPEEAEQTKKLLQQVWKVFGRFSAIQLSNMTHQPGTPWYAVAQQYGSQIPKGTDIPRETIREYFVTLGKRNDGAEG